MAILRTYAFISILLISTLALSPVSAKKKQEYIPPAPLFCGGSVQCDLSGPVMKALDTKFNQLEVAGRLNFRDKYFPICELGIGEGTRTGKDNDNRFHTSAPYFRVGLDYKMNPKHNGNRIFLGCRYAFTSYEHDFTAPTFTDPYWGVEKELNLVGQRDKMQWLELLVGCETKLWKFVRVGWTLRYKGRLHKTTNPHGEPWYVPGYGKNGPSTFGGTMNLVFEISRTTKKEK